MSDLVLGEDSGSVRVLTPSDPTTRNALSAPMRLALRGALGEAMADTAVRAVVTAGAGGVFCSGGDTSAMLGAGSPITSAGT